MLIDKIISQLSIPNGRRTIITTGDVKGIMLIQKANDPDGLSITGSIRINDKISGIVTGKINCWVSASESTADPTAAKRELYNKYPERKYESDQIINGKSYRSDNCYDLFAVGPYLTKALKGEPQKRYLSEDIQVWPKSKVTILEGCNSWKKYIWPKYQ